VDHVVVTTSLQIYMITIETANNRGIEEYAGINFSFLCVLLTAAACFQGREHCCGNLSAWTNICLLNEIECAQPLAAMDGAGGTAVPERGPE
jgi:hypothetical protein